MTLSKVFCPDFEGFYIIFLCLVIVTFIVINHTYIIERCCYIRMTFTKESCPDSKTPVKMFQSLAIGALVCVKHT